MNFFRVNSDFSINVHYIKAESIVVRLAISNFTKVNIIKREKSPVLFMHGATVSSQFTSEYVMDGVSWMSALADQGWESFGLDLPGYGRSDSYEESAAKEVEPSCSVPASGGLDRG